MHIQPHTFVSRSLGTCWLTAALILLLSFTASAQLTWDANTTVTGPQNTDGTANTLIWNTLLSNWWNGTADTTWVNSTTAIAQFGTSVPTPATANAVSVTENMTLQELRFLAVTTGSIVAGQQYSLNGSVAGITLDFGTNGIVSMEDRSSGGSQFIGLGANLRLKGNNLRFQKYGAGTTFMFMNLNMLTSPELTGTLTVGGSIYLGIVGPGILQTVSRVVVEAGGSIVTAGTGSNYSTPFTLAGFGNSLLNTSTAYGAIRLTASNVTLSGGILLSADAGINNSSSGSNATGIIINAPITDGGGNFGFSHFAFNGNGTVSLAAANTYGGTTTLGKASTLYTGSITILDFTAVTSPQNDILYNGLTTPGALSLFGGVSVTTLRLAGNNGQTNSQRFGNVTVAGTYNSIEMLAGVGGNINVSLGTVALAGSGATSSTLAVYNPLASNSLSTTSTGFLGPWASYTGELGRRSWAQGIGGQLSSGYAGSVVYTTGGSLSTAPFSTTANASIDNTSTGTVALGPGTSNLNTLSMNDLLNSRQIGLGTGQTLRLSTLGGIQIVNGALNLTVGINGQTSTLSAGGTVNNTAGSLYLSNQSDISTLTINSVIANNGTGAVTLVINGAPNSHTILTGTNTYTGGTRVDSGILEIRSSGALSTSGTVTLTEASGATLGLSGGVTLNRALAGMAGLGDSNNGAIRSLSGSNVISALITQVAPTFISADAGATLLISATTASTTAIDGGFALTLGGAGTITVSGRLNIGASTSGSLTKTGTGTVILTGDNTYAAGTTVSAGTLRLGSTTALGASTGVTISSGASVDLNGQTTDRIFSAINGTGVGSLGALMNSSGTTATLTGTTALASASNIGGSGSITISNATGITGNVLLTKIGSGTLTVIDSTTTSARTGINEIDAGTLRIQSALAITPIGSGAYALNSGTLSLGFDLANTMTNLVNVLSSSTIIVDRASAGAGGIVDTLGALTIGGSTLTVTPGANVTSSTIGLTLGITTIGGAQLAPGNPTFDVQSTAAAALTLTLGALSDQAIGPRTITFQNSGAAASTVTLATAATSLVDGTVVNINNGTNAGVTVNMNIAGALGSLSQVNVNGNSTLTTGITSVVLGSLGGTGTVNASGAFTLIVGNAANATLLNSNFSGVLANGTGTLALTKAGLGTLTLSGSASNTFTGATTVNSGTLILGKTGGATAVTTVMTIGSAAASTTGNATVRLGADDQMAYALAGLNDALVINAGGTLDMNGHMLTVNTLATFFGATVTGSGTLAINRTAGTLGFSGINTISSTFQLTTVGSGSVLRTISVTTATDLLTISGSITQASGVAGLISKTTLGTLVLSGDNSYSGTTTVSAGILNIRSATALGTTVGNTAVSSGATLQIQGGVTTTAEPLALSGGAGFVGSSGINIQTGAFVNVSGVNNYAGLVTLGAASTISSDSGTLNLTNAGTLSGATFALTLAGAGNGSILSIIGTTTGTVTKNGTGTWTLTGVNTSTGAIVINAGTLKVGDGTTGKWSSAPGLTFTGSGTFEYGGATVASTQALGALTLTSGSGVLKVDAPASGSNAVTFTSLVAPAQGSGLNIVSPTGTSVTISGAANTNGIVNPRLYYNGVDFAAATAGVIGAAATTTATSSMAAGNTTPYLISGSFAQTSSVIVNAGLKFAGGDTLTISNGTLLTINNGTNTAGGILVTGGVAAVIANEGSASGLTTAGTGDLVIGTNATGDSLSIQVSITSTTTGGLTKNGAGTLTLTVANAYTGATSINAGTLVVGNTSSLSTSAATVQVGGVLDLNGNITINTAVLNGTGISSGGALVNNSGTAAAIGAITVGSGNGTGGIGASIGGTGGITSTGVLSGNNILVKTGTGTLTVGDNAGTAQASTRTAATRIDSGILRISNSTSALGTSAAAIILNGGTLSLGSAASVVAYPVSMTASSSIISDVYAAGAGLTHTLGVLAIGTQTLTIQAGSNVTTPSTNAGVTFGATTLLGSPTFDVQSPTTATGGTTTLTLGALSDQGVAKTITFANSGTSTTNSIVTLATAMASMVDGTLVTLNNGTKAGVTLNLNLAAALGTLTQVTVNGNSILNIGAAQTLGSLTGSGTVTASGVFTLTVGNASSSTPLSTAFTGSLSNGTGTLALTKNGLGTLTLSGASSYTGLTTVSLGILKLNNAIALGATSGVTISIGGTVDLNGQTTDRNFSSVSGTGHTGLGAIINSSSTLATLTGTLVQAAAAKIGGSGDIFVNNVGGITGSFLLTKVGSGMLTVTSTASSARTGITQIDAGTLRLQAATVIAPVGTGAMALNGGTLSLGYDAGGTLTNLVNVLSDSGITVDRATSGAGGFAITLGALTIGSNKLTVTAGANVTGTIGLSLGAVSIGGASMQGGNPIFDVQSTATATTTLTLAALNDQAITPRTLTFQNSGTTPSAVTLATAATSLVDGTVVNLASTGGAVTVNLNITNALGGFAQVTVGSGDTLSLGAAQTIASLNGAGTVSATVDSILTIGNILSPTVSNSTFNGVLAGSNLSITKSGTGTLTLGGSDSNTFGGSTGAVINSGTVILAKTGGAVAISTNVTVGSVNGAAGTALLQTNGSGEVASTAAVTINEGSTMNLNGYNQAIGNLNGTPSSTVLNNATATTATLTVGSGNATGGQYLGNITDNTSGTGTMALTKTGTGSALLGGWNTYTGTTVVQGGTLQVGGTGVGSTGTGAVTVQGSATILGTGTVQGSSFTALSGSTIQAGDSSAQASYGTLNFKPVSGSGTLDFQSGSTIILGITASGTADLLNIVGTGTNTLLFNSNLTVAAPGFVPTAPMIYNLLDWSGLSAAPTFDSRFTYTGSLLGNGDEASGLDLPDISGSGYYWDISSFTTNGTIAVVIAPEPSRLLLLVLALGMLLIRRRR